MVCNFEIFLNRLNISYFIKLWTFCNFFDLTVPISFFDIHSIRTPIEKYWQKNVHIWFLKQQRCFKLLGYSQIGLEVGGPWGLRFIHIFKGQVHGLQTPDEKIALTARPKLKSQSQIYGYGRRIFCLPHRPKIWKVKWRFRGEFVLLS